VPLPLIQRQLGHAYLSTTGQGISSEEIISTVHARRAPMMHASAGLALYASLRERTGGALVARRDRPLARCRHRLTRGLGALPLHLERSGEAPWLLLVQPGDDVGAHRRGCGNEVAGVGVG
jgi:hypothetical protein